MCVVYTCTCMITCSTNTLLMCVFILYCLYRANNEKELQPNTNKAIHGMYNTVRIVCVLYTVGSSYDIMAEYYRASQMYQVGPLPPPPDLQPIVDRTADYVAKNGVDFQRTVINRHIDDRRFDFLHPWNEFHNYYKMRVEKKRQELQDSKPLSTQPLTPSGSVSFKLTNNTLNLPIGVVDHLNFDPVSSGEEERTEQDLTKRQKLSIDSSGQIDSEFKVIYNYTYEMLLYFFFRNF